MTRAREIRGGVSWLGAIDWERRMFDALIPLPDGTSYNCYLVRGSEKTVLVDTVDPARWGELEAQLAGVERLDHVVVQHMEQDHSGCVPNVLRRFPAATVVTNPRCKGMLLDHLEGLEGIGEQRFLTVDDGDRLELGGRTLRFIYTPFVHMPETMCTFLEEERILFSCDLFGSHLATSDLFADDQAVLEPAKRYYAQIMMPFAKLVAKNLDKLQQQTPMSPVFICPSHGPVHASPELILAAYREWASGPPRNLVCLAYVSMHGSTLRMVDRLTDALLERGVAVERFDLAATDLGRLGMSLLEAATLVLGSPTVLTAPHPTVAYAALLASELKGKARQAAVIGSFGWGGKVAETLAATLAPLKLELLDPVMCKGLPRAADEEALDRLADRIAERHKALGLAPRRTLGRVAAP